MDSLDHISTLIDQLDDNLDNLQDALKTIINKSMTDMAASYPVLDRAKFYILITYAIESAIFSFLRLTGTSAREHPVYRELERVKQYFQKARLAEGLQKPTMRIDQSAAGRFIKAALAGNDAIPVRQSRLGSEITKTLEDSKASEPDPGLFKKRKAEAIQDESTLPSTTIKNESSLPPATTKNETPVEAGVLPVAEAITEPTDAPESEEQKAQRKKEAKQKKKEKKRAAAAAAQTSEADESTEAPPKKKHKKHKNKESKW